MIKAVIFDLDGTLIDSMSLHLMSLNEILLERGTKADRKHLISLLGLPTKEILRSILKKYNIKEDGEDLHEERRYHYFRHLGNKDILFPKTIQILNILRKKYRLAIATGSSSVIVNHSTNKNFRKKFQAIVTINDVKNGKPSPEQFLLAAKKINSPPNECLAVGDSVYDAESAQRAGMPYLGITTGFHKKIDLQNFKNIGIINSLDELPKILQKVDHTKISST